MNAKFALALVLTLQVSLSFCEVQDPPQELVEKYEMLKDKLSKRAEVLVGRVMTYLDTQEQAREVKGQLQSLPTHPKVVVARQVGEALLKEAKPVTDDLRRTLLGFYSENLREYIGPQLDAAIQHISSYLDQVAPAE